jgi:hypothetical protein
MLSMQGNSINIFIIIILDYQVVILKHNQKSHMNIGELAFLQNDSSEQESPRTEGVAEIQIDIHLVRE